MIPHPKRFATPAWHPCPCRSGRALRWHCSFSWPSCFAPGRLGHGTPPHGGMGRATKSFHYGEKGFPGQNSQHRQERKARRQRRKAVDALEIQAEHEDQSIEGDVDKKPDQRRQREQPMSKQRERQHRLRRAPFL